LFILAGSWFSDTKPENRRLMQSKPPLQEVPSVLAAMPMAQAPSLREGLFIASGCLLIFSWFPSGMLAQGLESKPSPTAADASPSPSVAISQASPEPISTATPVEPPSQEIVRDINALLNKSPSEVEGSFEVKSLSEVKNPSEVKSYSEAKNSSEATTFDEAFRSAWDAANEQRYNDAVTEYAQAIRLKPDDPILYTIVVSFI
jgi:hypothetical protein